MAQQYPKQKSLVTSLPFFPCLMSLYAKVSQVDFRETAAIRLIRNQPQDKHYFIKKPETGWRSSLLGRFQKPFSYKLVVPHTCNQQFQPEVFQQKRTSFGAVV